MSGLENKILNRAKLLETNAKLIETKIKDISKLVSSVIKNNGKLMFCGNGGSASDSIHISSELVGKFEKNRKAIPSISLSSNISNLTAIANDFGFEHIFSRQIEAIGKKGDLLIAISTSTERSGAFPLS